MWNWSTNYTYWCQGHCLLNQFPQPLWYNYKDLTIRMWTGGRCSQVDGWHFSRPRGWHFGRPSAWYSAAPNGWQKEPGHGRDSEAYKNWTNFRGGEDELKSTLARCDGMLSLSNCWCQTDLKSHLYWTRLHVQYLSCTEDYKTVIFLYY